MQHVMFLLNLNLLLFSFFLTLSSYVTWKAKKNLNKLLAAVVLVSRLRKEGSKAGKEGKKERRKIFTGTSQVS